MGNLWRYALAANIKKTRIDDNGVLRYGTAVFKGNTKVYLCGRLRDELRISLSTVSVRGFGRFRLLSAEKTKKERLKCRVEK